MFRCFLVAIFIFISGSNSWADDETDRSSALIQTCTEALASNDTETVAMVAKDLIHLRADYQLKEQALNCLETYFGEKLILSWDDSFKFASGEREQKMWSEAVTQLIKEARQDCSEVDNGTVEVPIDAVEYVDLNNDGKIDEILNYGKLRCSTYSSIWSGSGGVRRALIVDGKVTNFLARSLKVTYPFGDYPIITMSVHGSFCGQVGSEACVLSTVWSSGKFQLPE